jgi:GNAT superfamily N-acetyltransferase
MQVIDLQEEHMQFVASCTHIEDPNEERDSVLNVRITWIREAMNKGLKVKVAIDDGEPVGFIHCLPIELGAWGMSGKDLMTIPCLTLRFNYVYEMKRGSGYGRALMEAVEEDAKREKKGVAVIAYDTDFWFMPYSFFKKLGYEEVERQGETVLLLKAFEPVESPIMHRFNFTPELMEGKVVVDAFWNPICLTSIQEIHRIRGVCREFGDKVILNEYNCGNKDVLDKCQTSKKLLINGKEKGWGYAAPKDELRKEIEKALESL